VHYKSEMIVQEIMELSQTVINNGVADNVELAAQQEGEDQHGEGQSSDQEASSPS
jgi:hypothetical protein